MVLIFHILIALCSVAYACYVFFNPSKPKMNVSYSLVGLTITSGTYLVVSMSAHLVHACVTGLVYLAAVFFILAAAKNRLATETNRSK